MSIRANETIHSPILVVKTGEEGGFPLYPQGNGNTATFDPTTLPEWAINERIASADIGELKDWLISRVGPQQFEDLDKVNKFDQIEFDCLKFDALDEEENLVIRRPSEDIRSIWLAELLGLDTDVEAYDAMEATAIAVAKTYEDQPADERAFNEVEGQGFEEVGKETAHG